VKQEVAKQLIEMGYSKNVAEKALFMNQSVLDKSLEWIYEHQQEPDFEEELRIMGTAEEQKQQQLTPEEIAKKAKEFSDYAHKKYLEKKKKVEDEQEKFRREQTREMAKAKREIDDAELRRFVEIKKQQKIEDEKEKQRMLEQLARDKEERFGKKFDAKTGKPKEESKTSPFESIQHYVKSIKTLYPTFRNPDTAKNCLNTIKVVITNILKNPSEEKFRKVKTTNPNFEERVGKIIMGMKILNHLGFQQDGEFLVLSSVDSDLLTKTQSLLEEELKAYS